MNPRFKGLLARRSLGITLAFVSLTTQAPWCNADEKTSATDPEPLLQAIKKSGEPVTLAELDAWYVTPPTGQNAASAYAQAFAAIGETNSKSPGFLTKNRTALELLHAAGEFKACRYPVDLKQGFDAKFPHLKDIRSGALVLKETAIQFAKQSKPTESAGAVADGLKLAQSLAKEPMVISQLVRIAAEQSVISGLEQSLAQKPYSDLSLITLQPLLRKTADRRALAASLASERAMFIALLQSSPEKIAAMFKASYPEDISLGFEPPKLPEGFGPAMAKSELATYLQKLAIYKSALEQSEAEGLAAGKNLESSLDAKQNPLTFFFLNSMPKAATRFVLNTASSRAADTALAVERFRNANQNTLPASLDELVPKFLPRVPADPFDGKPVRYKKLSPAGYVVYSVGPNLKDDGGTPRLPGGPSGSDYDTTFTVKR